MTPRILIIDDDQRLGAMLAEYLGTRGYEVTHELDARAGLRRVDGDAVDAIVLDVMLPDLDGFEVLRRVRSQSHVPILMLTARGDDMDRIVGLELGADDYLPKPFNPRELLARLSAILRRSRGAPPAPDQALRFGALVIDRGAREVRVDGQRRELTSRQFDLLCFLAERAGRVQSRDRILEALKGEEWENFDRSIDVHISRIRSAIEENPRQPRFVQTVRGAGYVFTPPAAPGADPRGDR